MGSDDEDIEREGAQGGLQVQNLNNLKKPMFGGGQMGANAQAVDLI